MTREWRIVVQYVWNSLHGFQMETDIKQKFVALTFLYSLILDEAIMSTINNAN